MDDPDPDVRESGSGPGEKTESGTFYNGTALFCFKHLRNARTAVTGAENAGKLDSMRRAQGLGVELKKLWLATRDSRTRDSHVMMDGEMVEVDEPFSNGCMYPGDPDGVPAEVYNCRCAMRSKVAGADPYSPDLSRNERLGGMSYDEWKQQAGERLETKGFKKAIADMRSKGLANLSEDELSRAGELASREFAKNYKKSVVIWMSKSAMRKRNAINFIRLHNKNNQSDQAAQQEFRRLSQKATDLQNSKAAALRKRFPKSGL